MGNRGQHPASPASLAPRDLRPFFRDLYRHAALPHRLLATWRASISPFEPLMAFVPAGARALDIGCGVGALLLLLAATGRIREGIGCDNSAAAIHTATIAQERLSLRATRFHCIADLAEVPNGPFEAVLMIDVLHHIPAARQQEAVLAAARRVAPGGVLIYKDMASQPVWRRWANTIHDLVLARQLVSYVAIANVEHWLERAGFAVVQRESYSRFVYGHELRVFRSVP
jgi:2-polyprenyl-3-methyl-5-hydroxy-6-metoxy-1,4-benzoquinol methylase